MEFTVLRKIEGFYFCHLAPDLSLRYSSLSLSLIVCFLRICPSQLVGFFFAATRTSSTPKKRTGKKQGPSLQGEKKMNEKKSQDRERERKKIKDLLLCFGVFCFYY